MADGWREVAASMKRGGSLALPWQLEASYHVEPPRLRSEGASVVGQLTRRSAAGAELARVVSTTRASGETTYELAMGGKSATRALPTLADAMSEADAELEAQGFEVIGRVVWT